METVPFAARRHPANACLRPQLGERPAYRLPAWSWGASSLSSSFLRQPANTYWRPCRRHRAIRHRFDDWDYSVAVEARRPARASPPRDAYAAEPTGRSFPKLTSRPWRRRDRARSGGCRLRQTAGNAACEVMTRGAQVIQSSQKAGVSGIGGCRLRHLGVKIEGYDFFEDGKCRQRA
jgi:hypothetical protein